MTPTRRRAWLWVTGAAILVLAPAGWLGAEYAIDLEAMARIRGSADGVRELLERTAQDAADAGEGAACDRVGAELAELSSPPWWRHVAFALLEDQQVQAASSQLAALRKVAAERTANRAWWSAQAATADAALTAADRTIPDLFALRDALESAQPPHPGSGGVSPDARSAAIARVDAEAAQLTRAQDELLQRLAGVAERVAQASDGAALDAALAAAPGAEARDLNPPELEAVREKLRERADAVRNELAFRAALEASVAGALSKALALDPEAAAAADAAAIVASIETMAVPSGARYAPLAESRTQALDAARRRLALLEARDSDRQWLEAIGAAVPSAVSARDLQELLRRLEEPPPGNCGLESVSARAAQIASSVKSKLQARRDTSRRWREDLAGAVDVMVAARTLDSYRAAADRVDALLALGAGDPSSSEDAQAERAARTSRRATAARLVREDLAAVDQAVTMAADPRQLPPDVAAALAADSPLAAVEEAQEPLKAIRERLTARLAEYEAFDGAMDRARQAMRAGDVCAAAEAVMGARARTAEQEWQRTDLRASIGEGAVEVVESLVLGGGALDPASVARLERAAECEALDACSPEAVRMARRVLKDVRAEADRALWEDCRRTALAALERRDPTTYLGALTRYIASEGTMRHAAIAARDAFAVPTARVVASEFVWGANSCSPRDAIADITVTVDGETWSGPMPAGEPGSVARLSQEWTVRSASDAVIASASGVVPCDEPEPFTGLLEITLNARRFGSVLEMRCPAVGTDAGERPSMLRIKVVPSAAWRSALSLPPWRSPAGTGDGEAQRPEMPPRPESDAPEVSDPAAPSPEAEPR